MQQPELLYKVAYQVKPKDDVTVMDYMEAEPEQVLPFVIRLAEIKSTQEFNFLEIHQVTEDGRVVIFAEIGQDWPKAKLCKIPGKIRRRAEVRATVDSNVKADAAIAVANVPSSSHPSEELAIKITNDYKVA